MAEGELLSQCDWCLPDKVILASRYCYECFQRLCKDCSEKHSRVRFHANHTLIDIVGKEFNSEAIELIQTIRTCPRHSTNNIEYICKDHDEACCSACVIERHNRKCNRLVPVSEECGNRTTEPCSTVLNTLTELEDGTNTLMQCEVSNEHIISESKKRVLKELASIKNDFDKAFKTLERQIVSDADNRCKLLLNENLTSHGNTEKVNNKIRSVICDTEKIVETRDPILCYLYDRQQRKAKTVSKLQSDVTELKDKVKTREIKFVEQTPIRTLCEQITKSLKVEVEESASNLRFGDSLASDVIHEDNIPCTPLKNVRLEYESNISNLNCVLCSCVWVNDFIILANNTNSELIQFDAKKKALESTFKCLSHPTSIVAIDDTRMAVCYDMKVIDILLMQQQTLVQQQRLDVNSTVLAASVDREKHQLVCLSRSGRVEFISLKDQIVRIVTNDVVQSEIKAGYACDIEYDNRTGNIYVVIYNKVLSFDIHSKNLREIVSSKQVRKMSPVSVTVDGDGCVYVVNVDAHSILQYDRNLNFIRQLVPENISLGDTCCMAFNSDMTMFAVAGQGVEKQLRVFCFC